MAVVKLPQTSTIAIKLQKGVTTSGSPAYVTRTTPVNQRQRTRICSMWPRR